jgi:hypothetical protein
MGKLIKNKSRKMKSKRRKMKKSRKIRKYKMRGGGIEPEDIMFQDDLVCILKPEVKKGIIIWTRYQQPSGMDSLCTIGLKTAKQLHTENIQFGRDKSVQHSYIFFRAPHLSNQIDYTSIDSEINSSYGPEQTDRPKTVYIRVDPDKTFVFASDMRLSKYPKMIMNTKILLSDYLIIIAKNLIQSQSSKQQRLPNQLYSMLSYELSSENVSINDEGEAPYPLTSIPINLSSEILVTMPHLTPNYFVKCT